MWKKHEEKVTEFLQNKAGKKDAAETLKIHGIMLKRLQHERLVHLIVTMTVAVCDTILLAVLMITMFVGLVIPAAMLTLLLIAYLLHYFTLENTVIRWYGLSDRIREKLNSSK